MTKNEENFLNKINEQKESLDYCADRLARLEGTIKEKDVTIKALSQPQTCEGCCKRFYGDNYNEDKKAYE